MKKTELPHNKYEKEVVDDALPEADAPNESDSERLGEAITDQLAEGLPPDVRDAAENALETAIRFTEERPLTALALAVVAGYLIGAATS